MSERAANPLRRQTISARDAVFIYVSIVVEIDEFMVGRLPEDYPGNGDDENADADDRSERRSCHAQQIQPSPMRNPR